MNEKMNEIIQTDIFGALITLVSFMVLLGQKLSQKLYYKLYIHSINDRLKTMAQS